MQLSEATLEEIDRILREGNHKLARQKLKAIPIKSIPSRLAAKISNLMVRAGELKLSAKLLHPLVFERLDSPSPQILAQYALTLQQMGAYNEASNFFESMDYSVVPEAHLYYALALFSKWEYDKAIPHLQSYVKTSNLTFYQRQIGLANLAQAYLAVNEKDKCVELLEQLEAQGKKDGLTALLAYVLDLRAQSLIAEKKYNEAIKRLNSSEKLILGGESRYQLMLKFWLAVCELGLENRKSRTTTDFTKLRQSCVAQARWSLVRECDFYQSTIKKDKNLFLKVYFGTPFPSYRKRLVERFSESIEIPKSYLWNPTGGKVSRECTIRAFEGIDVRSQAALKRGQVLHRLLRTLCTDFYTPFTPESLFFYLFTEEKFNPLTSSKRSQYAISRLQEWLNKKSIPISIRFKDNYYRLFFTRPYQVEVELTYDDALYFDSNFALIEYIKLNPNKTAKQISSSLKEPLRSTQRRLSKLQNDKKIIGKKSGREIVYSVATNSLA